MMNEPADIRTFTVSDDEAGQRLDSFLTTRCPDFSRNQLQNSLQAGLVDVDGRSRPKGFRLRAGSTVRFVPPEPEPARAVPQDIPLDIVYEDEHLLVVDKGRDLVVHPAPGHPDGTLVNGLLYHCAHLAQGGDLLRPGIVHRLDRDTTGLLAVALNDQAHRSLTEQLRRRTMRRSYSVLSWGCWQKDDGVLRGDIGRHHRDRKKMAVVEQGGRPAETHYRVREDFGFCQLCDVELKTGRTHQIRVHFACASHPVVGDPLYGDDRRARNVRPSEHRLATALVKQADRQMLHAARLGFDHPATGQSLEFVAELPPDMADAIAALRVGNG